MHDALLPVNSSGLYTEAVWMDNILLLLSLQDATLKMLPDSLKLTD